jgi:tRNA threonylcarbamoyladenosine biosynthesis protein TsaE
VGGIISREILSITSGSPEETRDIGAKLAEFVQAGDVLLLVGGLGSGKTCLAQGIAWGLDIDEYASSPSFVVIKEYRGRLPLYHIDLYRLNRIEEVMDLGLDDYLHGRGACVIEWAEKGLGALPGEHLLIEIEYLSEAERQLCFQPRGKRYMEMLSKLRPLLSGTGKCK